MERFTHGDSRRAAASGASADWRVWQILDSAFPVGGFAHSGGFEAAWQAGWLRSSGDAAVFVVESLEQMTSGAIPFVAAAVRGDDALALDAMQETYLSNHVANRASRLQGMTFMTTAAEVFEVPELNELRQRFMESGGPGHFAVVFGTVMRLLNIEVKTAVRMFLFVCVRGVLSAGVRLGVLGPYEAQRLQGKLDGELDRAAERAMTMTLDDVCQTAPLLELLQMGQDRLYSRLFQS